MSEQWYNMDVDIVSKGYGLPENGIALSGSRGLPLPSPR